MPLIAFTCSIPQFYRTQLETGVCVKQSKHLLPIKVGVVFVMSERQLD